MRTDQARRCAGQTLRIWQHVSQENHFVVAIYQVKRRGTKQAFVRVDLLTGNETSPEQQLPLDEFMLKFRSSRILARRVKGQGRFAPARWVQTE